MTPYVYVKPVTVPIDVCFDITIMNLSIIFILGFNMVPINLFIDKAQLISVNLHAECACRAREFCQICIRINQTAY